MHNHTRVNTDTHTHTHSCTHTCTHHSSLQFSVLLDSSPAHIDKPMPPTQVPSPTVILSLPLSRSNISSHRPRVLPHACFSAHCNLASTKTDPTEVSWTPYICQMKLRYLDLHCQASLNCHTRLVSAFTLFLWDNFLSCSSLPMSPYLALPWDPPFPCIVPVVNKFIQTRSLGLA